MRYAKVVLGLPVDEIFDYLVPEQFSKDCSMGCRVGGVFWEEEFNRLCGWLKFKDQDKQD